MKATETKLLDFLKGPKQFTIPLFQRPYSWTPVQVEQLWKDVLRAATDPSVSGHFLGAVVYIEKGLYHISSIPQFLVIDGQQRLTAISLILAALAEVLERHGTEGEISPKKLRHYFLFNPEEDGALHDKLHLTQGDRDTLVRLLTGKELPNPPARRLVETYQYFMAQIEKSGLDLALIYKGLSKLIIVDIALNREHDNPQLIFESLNSTGLELGPTDLIRNFVLMGLDPKAQAALYTDYWQPMEAIFGAYYEPWFDRFIHNFLVVNMAPGTVGPDVYPAFKQYAQAATSGAMQTVVETLYQYAKYYACIALGREPDPALRAAFYDLATLKAEVAHPLLLEAYHAYTEQRISRTDLLNILRLLESYLFRRSICGLPPHALAKTFELLRREVDPAHYVESLTAALMLQDHYRRFPRDDEFKRELVVKDMYHFRYRNYWLRKLENAGRKEWVPVEQYTIEHIMPQTPRLSAAWQADLGPNWKTIHQHYVHTIGNLTLTGYNAELSTRAFQEKRDLEGGFADSPLRLNRGLAKLAQWDENAMVQRAGDLANWAAQVWPMPSFSATTLEAYRAGKRGKRPRKSKRYTLNDHKHLQGDLRNLFDQIRTRIINLDASVEEEILKHLIAFRTTAEIVHIVPRKTELHLYLNLDYAEVDDPTHLAEDVSQEGHWGTGQVRIALDTAAQIPAAIALIRQAFDKHFDLEIGT